MTKKERIQAALQFRKPDRPPHFEILFHLTQEAFGLPFPENSEYERARGEEKEKLFAYTADIYARIVEEYHWDAVCVIPPFVPMPYTGNNHAGYEFIPYLKEYLAKRFGEEIPVGGIMWQSMISIDAITDYMEFSVQLLEERSRLVKWAEELCERGLIHAEKMLDAGADFIIVASDHAFNSGTMLSPDDFSKLVTPYAKKIIKYIQSRGAWVVFHTDGNLMKVIDQFIDMGPDVLQSIDPMAGMDIAEVKRLTYGKMTLMGNVHCGYLQDGPIERILESTRYCLEHGAPGGGYILSSSNSIFAEVPLEHYQVMLSCFAEFNRQNMSPA